MAFGSIMVEKVPSASEERGHFGGSAAALASLAVELLGLWELVLAGSFYQSSSVIIWHRLKLYCTRKSSHSRAREFSFGWVRRRASRQGVVTSYPRTSKGSLGCW